MGDSGRRGVVSPWQGFMAARLPLREDEREDERVVFPCGKTSRPRPAPASPGQPRPAQTSPGQPRPAPASPDADQPRPAQASSDQPKLTNQPIPRI